MKLLYRLLLATTCVVPLHIQGSSCQLGDGNNGFNLRGISFFSPRSQSTNGARDIVGWHSFINKKDQKNLYGATAATASFGQILRAQRVAQVLFGHDNLTISGSQVQDRGANDLLADYFGLSPMFQSSATLHPFIRTGLVDLAGYLGWDNFYFRIHAPVVYTRWRLGIDEVIVNDGSGEPFPADYMAATAIPSPITSWKQAVQGGVTYGQVTQGIQDGKFGCSHSLVGLSDLQMALGWNFINQFSGFCGLNLRVSAPTGSRPKSEYLFEPIVGNGKHWEFGVGISAAGVLWAKDDYQRFSFFTDINVMHLFNARQRRSFDFTTNGMSSRYMLVKEFDAQGNYTGNTIPAINVTTLDCKVSNNIQLDIVLMFGYNSQYWTVDLGYNGWIRTREIIQLEGCMARNKYGFKGIQNVTDIFGNNINTTQNFSTIHGNYLSQQASLTDPNSPVFVNTKDLYLPSAASPMVITHKFFTNVSYAWADCQWHHMTPYLGIGGEVEFEGINTRKTVQNYNDTLSQWSLWLKGGFGF